MAYTGNIRVEVVKHDKLLGQRSDHRDLFLGVVVDHFLCEVGIVLSLIVQTDLLVHKAVEGRLRLARCDG